MRWLRRLLGEPKDLRRLPTFMHISPEHVPVASILLFYGGNKLSEIVGNWGYKHPFKPPAYHAASYVGRNEFLNIGKLATIERLTDKFRAWRRIDAIIMTDITNKRRQDIAHTVRLNAGKNFYDFRGYVRFGKKFKLLRFLKFIKASKKSDFCSDNVVDDFQKAHGVPVSFHSDEDTAPWHLLEHALKHLEKRDIRTVWVGPEFQNK